MQGAYAQLLGLTQGAFAPGGQAPGYSPALNQQVAGFTPDQLSAMQGILGQVGGAQGLAGAGGQNLVQTLSGQFLDPSTNPYLQATYEQAARGLTDQYRDVTAPSLMAAAQRSGNFGGSSYNQDAAMQRYGLGENLGHLATDIFGGAYEQERGRQMQGLGLLPQTLGAQFQPQQEALGVGTLQQQQQQTEFDAARQNALQQIQWMPNWLQQYAQTLGMFSPGSGQTGVTVNRGIF